jgi:predicted metal-binding membrane protein
MQQLQIILKVAGLFQFSFLGLKKVCFENKRTPQPPYLKSGNQLVNLLTNSCVS